MLLCWVRGVFMYEMKDVPQYWGKFKLFSLVNGDSMYVFFPTMVVNGD